MMKVSIVNAILDSPEIARRHILHYNKMNLPDDVEVIFVDDGSNPPLDLSMVEKNFCFLKFATNDFRMWTQPSARNFGAKRAEGEYLILTDIDHIISREVIEIARNPKYDVIRFKREAGVLDENGDFTQDIEVLKSWGLIDRYIRRDLQLPPHGNSSIIRKDLYLDLGGVSERYCGTGVYPNREEIPLKQKLHPLRDAGEITILEDFTKPTLYMMPNGKYCGHKDYNPFGFFHSTSRLNNKDKMRARKLGAVGRTASNKEIRRARRARFEYSHSR
jgi:glycosyltransferase involved in cell wall biosynthesis